MTNKLQPRLRFKGFTDAWTRRTLGELVVNLVAGVSVRSSDIDTGVSVLKTSAVANGKVDSSETKPIIYEDISRAKASLVKESILISRMNTPALVGAVGIVETTQDSVYLPDRLWMAQVVKDVNPNWLNQALNTPQQSQAITSLASGTSGSMKNISRSQMLDLEVNIPPDRVEQTHTGEFFQVLENLITINQRKCSQLQRLKRAYLQQLFPAPGEALPQLRFPGFENDWETGPLGDVASLRKESAIASRSYSVDIELENLVSDLGIIVGDTSLRTASNSVFATGDVLFGRLRPYLNKWWFADTSGVKSGEIWALTSIALDSNFLYAIVQGRAFLNAANLSTGSKMPRADWDQVSMTEISYPSVSEQQEIGRFFQLLDQLTLAQNARIDYLKTSKHAYLQQMFV